MPTAVVAAADDRAVRLVWRNAAGGLTFEAGQDTERCFIKWSPAGSWIDLALEAERLSWAAPFHPVPRVLTHGADVTGSWLVTAALPGDNAVSRRWAADPATADRWADIAVATWSAEWNYGPGWEPLLLDSYGIRPDPGRTRYYRLLWDLSS